MPDIPPKYWTPLLHTPILRSRKLFEKIIGTEYGRQKTAANSSEIV
jgi:hypothetical protein